MRRDDVPRVLTRADARARGLTEAMIAHRVAAGSWRRILPHTYLTSDVLTESDRLLAAERFVAPDGLLTGAAALVGELRCVTFPATVLALVPYERGLRSSGWLQVRPTEQLPARRRGSERAVVPVARAIADFALAGRRLDDVRAVVTEAVRRELTTPDELDEERRRGARRGSKHLRCAIEEVAAGAWSAPEARAGSLLRASGVPAFEQNAEIELPGGGRFVADFLWRALRAVLEIDSIEHHFSPADLDVTSSRHLRLETLGYSVIHRTPAQIYRSPERFVRDVDDWLRARTRELSR